MPDYASMTDIELAIAKARAWDLSCMESLTHIDAECRRRRVAPVWPGRQDTPHWTGDAYPTAM